MQPKNKNPIQDEYDHNLAPEFDHLKQAEQTGTASDSNTDSVKNAEENPKGNWSNNVTGTGSGGRGRNTSSTSGNKSNSAISNHTGPTNAKIKITSLKKKGPLVAIIITLVGGSIGIVSLLSPSLLIVQFKEVMVNKFNSQLASMDVRNTKLLSKKMGTTKGLCTTPASILCKYSTMSEKQVAKFEKAGIHVVSDGDKTLLGRVRPKSFKFQGKSISAKNFSKEIGKNPEFRSAVKLAYNPKFAGFADAIWAKAAAKLGISKKAANIDGNTDDERLKSIQEDTKNPAATDAAATERVPNSGETNPDTGNPYTQDEIDAIKKKNIAAAAANELASGAETAAKNAAKAAPAVLAGAKSAVNTLKVTGLMDNACTVYGTIQAIGYAAKTVRALQLARYAMIFLNVADQIKSGDAKAKDVSYLGTILTTEFISKNKSGNIVSRKSATASFGYNFAAYGHRGTMSNTASQFLAGGGLTGDLINMTSKINSILHGSPKKTCGVLNNPIVSVGSLVGGIALFLIPGAQPAIGAWDAIKAAAGIALNVAMSYAPALLQDIVAGVLVDKTTVGEAAGDAITSGSSGIMSTAAKTGGNAPLTPSQAVAYSNLSSDIAAQYAQEDQLAYGPLDPSNSNTFMGKIVGQLTPYLSNMSSLSGIFSSITSITTGSFATLTAQTANATSTGDYTMCQDDDYKALGLATDPYCNVTYGIPPEALKADPIDVASTLINSGQIDPDTGDPMSGSDYESFVAECTDRATPLGDTGSGNTEPDGSACIFGKDYKGTPNNNYYIHYIDQRVQTGLDGEEMASNTTTDPSTTTGGTTAPSGTDRPDNVVSSGKGWTLKDGVDYSSVQCASGTTDKGTYHHPVRKFTIRLCQTAIGEVASIISQKAIDMINAAKKDGISLTGSGFRSYEEQKAIYAQNCHGGVCSPPTAVPGNSNHEKGTASDLHNISVGNAAWNWLTAHAADYGYINFPAEAWHWSMSGN
ncbi:MAG: M15 family metallopeptidase [Candidatus Saccharibacteria bacterium]|nr:M15 family metallopeptidase [Candidatus Saccharibacteria bacterium]